MAYKPQNKIKKEIENEMDLISEKITKLEKLPDAKKHQTISFIKSLIRIAGYIFIPVNLQLAMVVLIFSEIIGIYEELV